MAYKIDKAYIIKRLKDFKRGILDFESLVDGIAIDLDIRYNKVKLAKLRDHLEALESELEDGGIKNSELSGLASEMFTIVNENKVKFSTIYKNLLKEEVPIAPPQQLKQRPQDPQPKQVQEPTEPVNEDPLVSNIDQHWMNPESMKSDLYRWLSKMQSKDPEMARMTMNSIRNILGKFRYKPEASKEQQIEQ